MLKNKNLCDPGKFMRHKRTPTNTVTHPGIMALKPDVVWVGAPGPNYKTEIAIKKCDPHEFQVQKTMNEHFPQYVPKVYTSAKCFDGFYMYSEYLPQGTLKKNKTSPNVDKVVYKTFVILKKIHDKYPSFRHNDLHVDNVLIKGDTPIIYDFGFANWHGNPMFDATLKKDYGIYAGNHPMYDFHFFVNSVCADLPARFKKIALRVFPKEYIGENSSVVKNWRLRSDVTHKNLPTMDQVIRAFSPSSGAFVMTFGNTKEKKTAVTTTVPAKKKSPAVKFTLANKRRVSNRKAELIRRGNFNNDVQAELQAIRNITLLKKAGLLTPSPSPKKGTMGAGGGFAAVARRTPPPVVTTTTTPRRRPRIGTKLCTSYKKDELVAMMRRLGHRVDNKMTLREMCAKLTTTRTAAAGGSYTRPSGNAVVNARKKTYPKMLRKNLYSLSRQVGIKTLSKDKKGELVNKLYAKLNKNIAKVLANSNKSTVTARQIAMRLARNYDWKNDRHVERVRLLKIYRNTM